MVTPLDVLLDSYNADALRRMALTEGLLKRDQKAPSKRKLVDALAENFFTRERVEASLARLTPHERAVLNRLQLRGGRASTALFERELVTAGLVTSPGSSRAEPQAPGWNLAPQQINYVGSPDRIDSKVFYDVIARLTLHGLVFSEAEELYGYTYKLNFHPNDTLFIPETIQPFLPDPEPIVVVTGEWTPARLVTSSSHLYLRELYLYWDYVRKHDVPLLKSGAVGKRSLKAINETLLTPDPALEESSAEEGALKLYGLRVMLQRLNLLQMVGGKLAPVGDRNAIPEFWLQDTTTQIARCITAWASPSQGQVTYVRGQAFNLQTQPARKALLTVLTGLPPNKWHTLDVVWAALRGRSANFLVSIRTDIERKTRSNWYYANGVSGQPAHLLSLIDEVEQAFIRDSLALFLLQAGTVELGFSDEAGVHWHAFRITAAGHDILAYALDHARPAAPAATSEAGRVVIQPNFQILALGPVSLATLARLDMCAERRAADVGAFEYHLSRQSVYRAQQAGFSIDAILDFLTQVNGGELAQNVRRSLQEWGAHHERIVFRNDVSLLQAAHPALLAELQGEGQPPWLKKLLAPTVALLNPRVDKQVIEGLLTRGVFPAVSNDQPSSADHSVTIDGEGVIQPIHSVPSLHLSGRLARVAEQTVDGVWRLTPASIGQAGGDRRRVEQALAELGKLSSDALDPGLVERIKHWGCYYGEAATESLTLIEFFDPQTLTELRQHPRFKGLLTPFHAGSRALAVAPTEKLADVERLLGELGVPLKRGIKR